MLDKILKTAGFWVAEFAVFFGVYLLFAGSLDAMELAEGFHRPPFYDLALALGLLSFGAGLVFARFLERWL